ncbi:uncharacterized protein [Diadema setosum]|uniref:uncharacterized protein n=1 Tax=Diadema setosum TaxID=31175 RepID=UPI003B3A1068
MQCCCPVNVILLFIHCLTIVSLGQCTVCLTYPLPQGNRFFLFISGLIIGLSICGSIIAIVLVAVCIWYLWKKKKACFDTGNNSDSQTALAASEEKDVELIKIRQGTVVLQPRPDGGEAEGNQDKPPAAEVQPSNPVISTSEPANDTKKKKMKRQNRVTPEPQPPVQTAELPPVQTAETHSHEA